MMNQVQAGKPQQRSRIVNLHDKITQHQHSRGMLDREGLQHSNYKRKLPFQGWRRYLYFLATISTGRGSVCIAQEVEQPYTLLNMPLVIHAAVSMVIGTIISTTLWHDVLISWTRKELLRCCEPTDRQESNGKLDIYSQEH